jgi:hypothetical protein
VAALIDGLARFVAAAGLGEYDPAGVLPGDLPPIALGAMPPTGDLAIVVTTYTGGPEPDSRNGWEYPRLQVRVRGANALEALDLERTVFEVLQTPGEQDLPGGSWHLQDCYALQSEAAPMGVDDNGRHEYARNYQLTVNAV